VNHTTVTVATIVVVAILATFVVGIPVITTTSLISSSTSSSSTTTQLAYAYKKERHNDEDIIGNTITNQKCTENGKAIGGSGNSFQQECRSLICTNPSGNAICLREEGTGTGPIGQPAPSTCEECFNNLTATQRSNFEASLPDRFSGFGNTPITTIEQLCAFLSTQQGGPSEDFTRLLNEALIGAGVTNPSSIVECVLRSAVP
jgi:hypothetical protein